MTKRNKLAKFDEVAQFKNVYENISPQDEILVHHEGREVTMKGRWREAHFNNKLPLTLELACGRGEYSNALAERFPDINFIGVDIKGARIWKGAKYALEKNLNNVAYLRTRIEHIDQFFAPSEVDHIWITFPDPHLRESKENKRLTSRRFLDIYKRFIKPGAIIHLKTDDDTLYDFTLETAKETPYIELEYFKNDIYAEPLDYPELEFKTYYEIRHLAVGKKIKYIRMVYNPS